MTPTEQDKELREKLTKLISQDGWVDVHEVDVDGQVNELVAIITADRKRVALEARIDEIKLTKDNSEESYLGEDWWADESIKDNSAHEVPLSYFENRIAELKALEEVK